MLNKAHAKVPQIKFVQMDLLQDVWPDELARQRFERIVSTYVFHEFDLATKVRLLERLAHDHLAAQGWIVIGDVAFQVSRPYRKLAQTTGMKMFLNF